MPIYEYQCESCGHQFERRQKMSDAPVKRCPECGESVRKLFSAFAGIVRGASTPCADSPCAQSPTCSKRSCQMLES